MKFTDCIEIVGNRPDSFEGEKRYISTGALDINHIDENSVEIITYEDRPSRADLAVSAGDVIFAKMAGTQKNMVIDEENEDNIYSTGFFAVRGKAKIISTKCLYYLVSSDLFLNQKDKHSSGATQRAITNKGLDNIIIRVPCYSEQEKIVNQLDSISLIIEERKKEVGRLDDLIKSRFVEMFGDPVSNPMGWPVKSLMEMGYCKNGMNFHTGDSGIEMYCLGVGDFKDFSVIDGTDHLQTISLNEEPSEESMLQDGDIVFVRSNGNKALVGRCVVVYPHDTPTTYSGFCIRYRLTGDAVITSYLLRVLKTDSMRKKMAGRGANIQNLNQQILASLDIPLPPLEMQKQFSAFVAQIDKSKVAVA